MGVVLVTGGAGFIGSHLVEALVHRGDRVRVLDDLSTGSLEHVAAVRSAIEWRQGDVSDPAVVRQAMRDVSGVVHVAAMRSIPRSLDDPVLCHRVNVDGTLQMLLAAREAGVSRVVLASSSAVYGDADRYPVSEEAPLRPGSPYAASKAAGEMYACVFRSLHVMAVVSLRYFNVFGPRMDTESGYAMAVPRFVASLLRHEPPPIYGDGLQRRDFIYVENAVQGALRALDAQDIGPGVFNIACGEDYSLLELLATLNEILGTRIAPRHLPARAGESRRTLADIRRAREVLGFSPAVSFRDGLAKTIAWFRQRLGTSARSAP